MTLITTKHRHHLQTTPAIKVQQKKSMKSSYGQCSLFLYPQQHDFSIQDMPHFISALQSTGFILRKIDPQEADLRFFTGDKYLDYIAYMGCAPSIQFEAGENGEDFCLIKIHYYKSAKLIYNKTQSRPPQCPGCKKPVKNWQQNKTSTTLHCDLCHSKSNIKDLNWRKMAGYAQLFIEITDIFPKEAIPQQLLLDKLSNITNTGWQYFYSCQ